MKKSMKISFDRFVLNEIASGNSNVRVPSLKIYKNCICCRDDATVLIDSTYTETNDKLPNSLFLTTSNVKLAICHLFGEYFFLSAEQAKNSDAIAGARRAGARAGGVRVRAGGVKSRWTEFIRVARAWGGAQ